MLVLTGIGIYSVISYAVTQGTHEIGIRVPLGASQPSITQMVVRQGLVLAGIGVALVDSGVAKGADLQLALGPMTWPHLLVRGLIAEQLYRAQQIQAGHPYHRV